MISLSVERPVGRTSVSSFCFDGFLTNRDRLKHGAPAEERLSGDARLLELRYCRLGESFLNEVEGTFTVALHDSQMGRSLIARDGMGNAALYYFLDDRHFFADAEPAALAQRVGTSCVFDPLRLSTYYAADEVKGCESFFRGVSALLPGEVLLVDDTCVRRLALPRPRLDLRIHFGRWEEYVEAFAELLEEGVRRNLEGSSRVAVLTSGGLDSPPLAVLAARELAVGVHRGALSVLSWRVNDPEADEAHLVEALARQIGTGVEWIECDDALPFANLELWPVHPSTPEQTAYRWFHQRSYARAAELQCSRVVLGFGGDHLYSHARRWAWDLLSAEGPGRAIDRLREVAKEVGWRRTLRSEVFAPLLPRAWKRPRSKAPFLEAVPLDRLEHRPTWPANLAVARRPRQAERLLALIDASGGQIERHYLAPFGLEQRTPLRDFNLVQFMLAVPDHLLRQGRESRPVLRAATKGLIPDEIRLRRRKSRFIAAIDRGLAPERMRWAKPLLLDPDALWRGYIRESAILGWLDCPPTDNSGRMGYLHAIYGELWRRERAGMPRLSADAVD